MPLSGYGSGAQKALANMVKQYGPKKGKSVFYGLANKRTGGFKGKNRGQRAANIAYAKGSHWRGSKSKGGGGRRSGVGRRRIRG